MKFVWLCLDDVDVINEVCFIGYVFFYVIRGLKGCGVVFFYKKKVCDLKWIYLLKVNLSFLN